MHSDYQPQEPIRARLERDRRAIDALLADPATDDLVLERLPNGEHAWLRPAREISTTVENITSIPADEPPARAIYSVTRFVHEVAEDTAGAAVRGLYVRIGEAIACAITDHEKHFHRPPAPIDTLEDLQDHLRRGA